MNMNRIYFFLLTDNKISYDFCYANDKMIFLICKYENI